MTSVFLVSAGEYSDYHIYGVFSTRENAQAYIDSPHTRFYGNDPEIEEYELDKNIQDIKDKRPIWHWKIDKDGKLDVEQYKYTNPFENFDDKGVLLFGYSFADTKQQAEKIAIERRQYHLRVGDWGKSLL